MPKNILAVDDSATMRKVLEITFAGDDYRVLAANSAQSALARTGDSPVAAVIDASLEGEDGYTLAKDLRARDPRLAIVLLASRYAPYDATRGRDAGVDDYADKPFDTQSLIDKVKKAIASREAAKPAVAPAPVAAHAPAPPAVAPVAGRVNPPQPAAAPAPRPNFAAQRSHTLSFEGSPLAVPAAAAAPSATRTAPSAPAVQPPAAQAREVQARAPAAPVSAASASAAPPMGDHGGRAAASHRAAEAAASHNGQLASKLNEIGLTAQQVDAVLALSREVVERVVWEVVPQMAEALIREEIARLMRDA